MMAVGAAAGAGVLAAQDRTPGEDLDDAAVSQKVKMRLLAFDSSAYAHVDVEVALGEVLLSGVTNTDQNRLDAERIAWGVGGVRKVDNQIAVGRGRRFASAAHDEWITARVRAKLIADKAIKGINFNIETHEGVVYLMGLARTDEEARRAAETASYVGGVTKVVSYIQIRRPPAQRAMAAGAPIEIAGGQGEPSLAAAMRPEPSAY